MNVQQRWHKVGDYRLLDEKAYDTREPYEALPQKLCKISDEVTYGLFLSCGSSPLLYIHIIFWETKMVTPCRVAQNRPWVLKFCFGHLRRSGGSRHTSFAYKLIWIEGGISHYGSAHYILRGFFEWYHTQNTFMENSQVYTTSAASPAPNSLPFLPMTPMASTSGSGCDTSSDRSPSTPGQASDLPVRTSYNAEPIDEAQEFGDHNYKKINYPSFPYNGYGAPTPRCADQSCTCHNNSQADYFSLEPTREIVSTSSQGNYVQNQLENGPEPSNPLPPPQSDFAQADEIESFFQPHAPADDAALLTNQGGWDLTEFENLFRLFEPGPPETEPAVISALRSISVQMSHIGPLPSGEMLLPKLMDCSALKCLKDIVSLWATGRGSMLLLNFLLDFCQNQDWFEERVWRNNNLGIEELRLLVMSERGRRESLKVWDWVSGQAEWLRVFGLNVPPAEELDLRRKQLESLPSEFSLVNLRLRENAEIVQVLFDDTVL